MKDKNEFEFVCPKCHENTTGVLDLSKELNGKECFYVVYCKNGHEWHIRYQDQILLPEGHYPTIEDGWLNYEASQSEA